ncbi:MAG: hypothetical protein GX887_09235 [Firmicutes bacterium]|nr:hypothetical protein [Bacillota bacterium]
MTRECVAFIDSEAVKTLLRARSYLSKAGIRFALRIPSAHVIRVFDLLGLDRALRVRLCLRPGRAELSSLGAD